ncbi:DUF5641 domain-containing protein [Trichonephila clavipes]|nr:DUF5641 domain-containing protein [Trichonephila clavipes]
MGEKNSLKEYAIIFDEWEALKIMEKVTEIDTDAYYLPHRAVFKISETKIRPVFDATAREGNNPSLNDCLLRGILTAATLLPKMWLQETLKVKLSWDSPLPLGLCNKFDKLFKEILLLQNLEIPRYCEMSLDSDLHVFVDASKNVYAACIFVRTKLASGLNYIYLELRQENLEAYPRVNESRKCSISWISPRHLLESKWFGGPEWLLEDAITWPTNELQCEAKVLDYLSDFARFQKRVKFRARLLKDLRGRFHKEIRVQKAHKTTRTLKVGEIVLIEALNKNRLYWPLGKVIEQIPGRDGKVRTLKLRCSNSEIIRPIKRVFPLEIQSAEMGESNDVPLDAEALKICWCFGKDNDTCECTS